MHSFVNFIFLLGTLSLFFTCSGSTWKIMKIWSRRFDFYHYMQPIFKLHLMFCAVTIFYLPILTYNLCYSESLVTDLVVDNSRKLSPRFRREIAFNCLCLTTRLQFRVFYTLSILGFLHSTNFEFSTRYQRKVENFYKLSIFYFSSASSRVLLNTN